MLATKHSSTLQAKRNAPSLLDALGRKRKGSGMNPIPDRLRAARHLAAFSSTDALASALGNQPGLSSFQLAAFERGDRIPKPAYVNEIAEQCDVDASWLYGEPGHDGPGGTEPRVAELEQRIHRLEITQAETDEQVKRLLKAFRGLAE